VSVIAAAPQRSPRPSPPFRQARQAIARRDQQKQKLQEAVQKRDGPRLHQVVNDWEFDRSDERKLMIAADDC
jgi:hypothetical protein